MVGIIILNYINYNETIECIRSIYKNAKDAEYEIIVVDNASNNNSINYIKKVFPNEKINYISLFQNVGFAKGNNEGIRLARKLNCKEVLLLNSDILTITPNFINKLKSCMGSDIAVINPVCIKADGKRSRPSGVYKRLLIISTLKTGLYYFWELFQNLLNFKYGFDDNTFFPTGIVNEGYIIQGCAYFLTNEFFEHYSGLYPNTFLYNEELNLAWYLHRARLKSYYTNDVVFIHKEGKSTFEPTRKISALKKFVRELRSYCLSLPLYFNIYKEEKSL